jgi:hypothetical protein
MAGLLSNPVIFILRSRHKKRNPTFNRVPFPNLYRYAYESFFLLVFFFTVVFTVVFLMVSTFFFEVSVPMAALSFFEVSGFTVESIFVVERESTFDESALLPEYLPLHAASDRHNANAINDRRM